MLRNCTVVSWGFVPFLGFMKTVAIYGTAQNKHMEEIVTSTSLFETSCH